MRSVQWHPCPSLPHKPFTVRQHASKTRHHAYPAARRRHRPVTPSRRESACGERGASIKRTRLYLQSCMKSGFGGCHPRPPETVSETGR
eukprot:6934336-Prymnesium_polylepis.1